MQNKISLQKVEYIAELARIGLTKEEKERFSEELSDILEYIEQLKEIDTKNIEPVSQATGLVNVVREDVAKDFDKNDREIIIAGFPEERDGFVKVKQVM
ncbi:MAG: Asp-tRNA(Asn)/Glu-tRNA(Gln) amidotransferase subunit GatC [Candidatus Pacebacteria bacterium]|nr:Asp-tRNA(Asn)/Glu-tRNA(Gln) amidotransferase subunit GatC [Candidatus Paceibacterota bacterium]